MLHGIIYVTADHIPEDVDHAAHVCRCVERPEIEMNGL